ncbi:MAG: thymidine phosphorylase [Acutalibacteraceae bacterium]
MRIYDIISHKRDGLELSDEEIAFFVRNYTDEKIEEYQAAALLMAIYLRGMTDREMFSLTREMARSGEMLDLSVLGGVTADKHSTGGVGDKTTLIVAPIVASLGLKVAKMSGRGLGHTGGTIDKLESIDGFRVTLSPEEFIQTVRKTGICVVGQSGNLAPADKKIYALRDATATVGSMPLIASSIMSKKLAAGSQCIVLDVKCGSGAFMKTPEQAESLAKKMVAIGKNEGRRMAAVITDMDTPLGNAIGNSLEIAEAVQTLRGQGSADLREVCLTLSAHMLALGLGITPEQGYLMAQKSLDEGSAYQKFREFIAAQGGNIRQIEDTSLLPKGKFHRQILARKEGYITKMNAERIGSCAVLLGAGREKKSDSIDYGAGIILHKKTGDSLEFGDVIAELFTSEEARLEAAGEEFLRAVETGDSPMEKKPLIYKTVM